MKSIDKREVYTIIECKTCFWKSDILNRIQLKDIGIPWYCDNCGKKVTSLYETFDREELRFLERKQIR